MDSTETPAERAKDSAAEKKEAPVLRKRPDRRRPTDFRAEAVRFVNAAVDHLQPDGGEVTPQQMLQLKTLFRNYSHNSGLRGKEKESVWKAVEIIIREAKSAS